MPLCVRWAPQNIESSVVAVPHAGFIAIAVLYFVFAAACLVTPAVVTVLTPRWSMVLAFTGFLTFCGANVAVAAHPGDARLAWGALVSAGAITGLAASFLWTAQGESRGGRARLRTPRSTRLVVVRHAG